MKAISRRWGRACLLACTLTALIIGPTAWMNSAQAQQTGDQPNVLVVMTDDQPYGSVQRMPFLSSQAGFVDFRRTFTNNALCCPSRAAFLSGLYSHHSGVETNLDAFDFDPTNTIATAFDDAGYNTGLFGKYLNHFPFDRGVSYRPPGWDRFVAFEGSPEYYDYRLLVDGAPQVYGSTADDYSTDVLANQVDAFIRSASEPFFAFYTPYGPHGPSTPAPRHFRAFAGEEVQLPPNFNKVGEGTHQFFLNAPKVGRGEAKKAQRDQWEALLSEDEAIERFFATLTEQGELDDTIVLFTSDNGFSFGAHRWWTKRCMFDECGHVPLMIRAPGVSGKTTNALVSNVDIAPTLASLAGITFDDGDGSSLVPIMRGESSTLHRPVLLRSVRENPRDSPNGWGLRTKDWKYIEYPSGEVDLFDLTRDPGEVKDLGAVQKYAPDRRALAEKLDQIAGAR